MAPFPIAMATGSVDSAHREARPRAVNTDHPLPDPVAEPVPAPEKLRFSGSGTEYFRIWIVNLALVIVTLGIYSAWAKVRRLQYFYRNTQLASSGFDYHGKPTAILKGRIIAFVLVGGANLAFNYSPVIGFLVFIPLGAVLPWLLVRSFKFRMQNTSWRGLRFGFRGTVAGSYKAFLLWPLLSVLTLGVLIPATYREFKAYQHGNSTFGHAPFSFAGTAKEFYKIFGKTFLFFLLGPVLVIALFLAAVGVAGTRGSFRLDPLVAVALGLAIFAFYASVIASGPYLASQLQNHVWNSTRLERHRFESQVRFRTLLWIVVSNFVLTVLTVGLYRPFAVVRAARYRIESMTFIPSEPLDRFVGQRAREVDAVGEELGEFLDIDIAL